ncbi:hypothetical protein ACIRVF_32590 [Kitasatospora sp. NPDC101157]|uniref:hypothetical protein n=1 Tax=Kitasatospora sp. NPDC101157 TaxID=3364098 RepID=UPI0037FBF95D
MPSSARRAPTTAAAPGRRSALHRLGEWCARHSLVVIVLWLVALAGVEGVGERP